MDKQARDKSKEILAKRKVEMTEAASTGMALKNAGKDTILFGVEREEDGYRVAIYYILDGQIIDKKVGASQLKHHALAIVEQFVSNFVIDSYNEPAKFFETVVVR